MNYHDAVNLFHIAGVSSIVGYTAYSNYQGEPIGMNFAVMIMLMIFVMVIYHAWRLYNRWYPMEKPVEETV